MALISRSSPLREGRGVDRGGTGFDAEGRAFGTGGAGAVSHPCFPLEILVVVPQVRGEPASPDLDHVRGDPIDEVAVVGDEDDGPVEGGERFLQHLLRGEVEVVGRLVHAQEGGRPHQHLREGDAGFLPAREHGDTLVHLVAAEQEGAEDTSQPSNGRLGVGLLQLFEDGAGRIESVQLMLSVVVHLDVGAERPLPAVGSAARPPAS